ncbi:hypothetical protein WMF18_08895 [Sorangium sp. So ce315]|uniref:HAMP domain-containing protein n=1 Tax=Sorangium sp. So ce315 TaxID=3133299 RepID=UPI003F5F96F4
MISDFTAGKVDGLPWTMEIVVRVLAKERAFLDPIEAKTTRDALLLASVIAAIVTAAAVVMAQLLTRPITRLSPAASQLAAGKLDTAVEARSHDDMGTLPPHADQRRPRSGEDRGADDGDPRERFPSPLLPALDGRDLRMDAVEEFIK